MVDPAGDADTGEVIWLLAYLVGIALTMWLTGRVEAFALVAAEDRGAVSVVWPITWLTALCVVLVQGVALAHERWFSAGADGDG